MDTDKHGFLPQSHWPCVARRRDDKPSHKSRARVAVHHRKGNLDEAMLDWTKAIQLNPNDALAFYNRGTVFKEKGNLDKALNDYSEAIRINPNEVKTYNNRGIVYEQAIRLDSKLSLLHNNLAWLLATCHNSSIRNGKKAVELAIRACELTEWKKWNCIGTLAAAYAEADDFIQAIKYQTQAVNMEDVPEKDRTAAQQRLNLYQQGKPYHEIPLYPL